MPEHASSSEENVCLIKDKIGFKLHLPDVCVVVTVGHYSFCHCWQGQLSQL